MIECYFDCSSPWTWLAFHKLRPLAAELGVTVDWKPVLVGGIFNTVNPSVYESRERGVPAKQAYLRKDLMDWARHEDLDIRFPPSIFPINSVKAMRACCWLKPQGLLEAFADAVFRAYWTADRDNAQDAVLADIASALGIDAEALLAAISTPEI